MDRFLDVLGQTELDPSRTNDSKNIDFFQILENFIRGILTSSYPGLSKLQLHHFTLALESYMLLKPGVNSKDQTEQGHLKRRKIFTTKAQKENWAEKLRVIGSNMNW